MTEESEDGIKKRVTKKMVLPNVTAQIFWLKNRKPEQWRKEQAPVADEIEDIDTIRNEVYGKES